MNVFKLIRFSHRALFFIITAVLFVAFLIWYDITYFSRQNFKDVIVEVHGLVFDIILFGIILSIYETLMERKETIKRYMEEIEDFRGWHDDEAGFRVAGILRRLEKYKVLDINLNGLNLVRTDRKTIVRCKKNLRGVMLKLTALNKLDLSGSDLQGAQLYGSHLRSCLLQKAKLNRADLKGSNLTWAHLVYADLTNADLLSCVLRWADLSNAKLTNTNLRNADLTGARFNNAELNGTKVYASQVEAIRLGGGDITKLNIVADKEKH